MVTPETILADAAREFGTTIAKIVGPGRVRALVEARAYAALWMRVALRMSYPKIGRQLGGRNHATVMYLCGKLPNKPPYWMKSVAP